MALDPRARAYLDRIGELGLPGFGEAPVDEARRLSEEGAPGLFGPLVEVPFEDRTLPGPDGPIPVRVYRTAGEELPVLVYFHGGGWVLGSTITAHGVCATLARLAGCVVCSVDYRLAPEHRYPSALGSAGGNLAAVSAIRARDTGRPLALQLLAYPVLDADLETPSYVEFADGYFLTASGMRWFWDQYLPEGDRFRPDVAPLRAADVTS